MGSAQNRGLGILQVSIYIYSYLYVSIYVFCLYVHVLHVNRIAGFYPSKVGGRPKVLFGHSNLLGFLLQVSQVVDRDCGRSYLETSPCQKIGEDLLQTSRSRCLFPTTARFCASHILDVYMLCISFNLWMYIIPTFTICRIV